MRCSSTPCRSSPLHCRAAVLHVRSRGTRRSWCAASHHEGGADWRRGCDCLIVDGTNVLCSAKSWERAAKISLMWGTGPSHKAIGNASAAATAMHGGAWHAQAFSAWLEFLVTAMAPTCAAYVVFDPPAFKSEANIRKQHVPGYLVRRHERRDGRGSSRSPGVAPPSSTEGGRLMLGTRSDKNGTKEVYVRQAESLGFQVVFAPPGREADDMIGSLVTMLRVHRTGLDGTTSTGYEVVVASGDSDMQQLISCNTSWLELLPWPSQAVVQGGDHPTAMTTEALHDMPLLPVRLHLHRGVPENARQSPPHEFDTAGDRKDLATRPSGHHDATWSGSEAGTGDPPSSPTVSPAKGGIPPASYPDYLALIGKAEAGVRGVGISTASAKNLIHRFGDLLGMSKAADQGLLDPETLRILPPPAKALTHHPAPSTSSATSTPMLSEAPSQWSSSETKLGQAFRNLTATKMALDCEVSLPPLTPRVTRDPESRGGEGGGGEEVKNVPSSSSSSPLLGRQTAGRRLASLSPFSSFQSSTNLLALLHPYHCWHVLSATPYVELLHRALVVSRGLPCDGWHVTPEGLLIDLVVAGPASADQNIPSSSSDRGSTSSTVVIMVLAPSDFSSSSIMNSSLPVPPVATAAAESLVKAIGREGVLLEGGSLPRALQAHVAGHTQVRIKHAKRIFQQSGGRGRIVVVPFYDVLTEEAARDCAARILKGAT